METESLRNIKQLIEAKTGLLIRGQDLEKFQEMAAARIRHHRLASPEDYQRLLRDQANIGDPEWQKLVRQITIAESYFFRDKGQFTLLREQILPELIAARQPERAVKIWSAGCSSGEEPYSLAILLEELLPQGADGQVRVMGTDINGAALDKARRGIYSPWSFRMCRAELKRDYFTAQNDAYKEMGWLLGVSAGEDEVMAPVRKLNYINIGAVLLVSIIAAFIVLLIAAKTVKPLNLLAINLRETAGQIASTVAQQERTATEQATMVNETNVTVDELNASARQSAEQAASAAELAQRASVLTDDGHLAVGQAIEAINSLKDKVGMVADQILRLGEQTSQIGSIANLVKDLATQTNMLALNAAVEAARAGDHGKGFAVVASEVRKLADQSKKSAEEAGVLIADIQKATNSTIMVTEESSNTVEEVTRNAHKLGELFETLALEAGRVFENSQQVVLNAKQQSAALNQIGEAMNNINASSKETAAGISQTKAGIQNLELGAQNLQAVV